MRAAGSRTIPVRKITTLRTPETGNTPPTAALRQPKGTEFERRTANRTPCRKVLQESNHFIRNQDFPDTDVGPGKHPILKI
ncbi:hypothetical protein HMPREF9720_1827 [Alistipes sp. HGB5]|nr:hypothetical protein HMPREF9720_1827 [Alistipes sp. HGB5]